MVVFLIFKMPLSLLEIQRIAQEKKETAQVNILEENKDLIDTKDFVDVERSVSKSYNFFSQLELPTRYSAKFLQIKLASAILDNESAAG